MAIIRETLASIRQAVAQAVDDCILATLSDGETTSATIETMSPPWFRNKGDDYFNDGEYEVYCYEGTNMGEPATAYDWVQDTHVLTVDRTMDDAYDTTSKLELHKKFSTGEILTAINRAINFVAGIYLQDIKDETTITLVKGTTNDDKTIYTYEYTLPTTLLYIHRVTTEGTVGGKKLTGTVSGAFTLGETVTGGTSEATGILSYGPSGGTYILVREVDGTFEVDETVTGGTSKKTCSSITAVEDETVGNGKFEESNVVDPRDWRIIKAYSPKIKFDKNYYNVVGDLRIRLEGQGSQDKVSDDTDYIVVPDDWLILKAITCLPYGKIAGDADLLNTFKMAEAKSARLPQTAIHPNSRAVIAT